MNQKQEPLNSLENSDSEIDLREIFELVWAEKRIILSVTSIAAILSVVIALSLTEIFRAEITLAPADTSQNSNSLGQFGGAAALLGVNIGGTVDILSTSLATLKSRQFIGRFIQEENLLVPLFASKWQKNIQESVIDETVFDPLKNEWLSEGGAPTELQAFRKFSGMLTVTGPDRITGLVTVSLEWTNPIEVAEWTNRLIRALNQELKERDVREASKAINYLQSQLQQTQLVEMQRVFYQLIESQTRTIMLADVREEYALRVIDPAVVPDTRHEPNRKLIAIIGTLIGGVASLIFVFIRDFLSKRKLQ